MKHLQSRIPAWLSILLLAIIGSVAWGYIYLTNQSPLPPPPSPERSLKQKTALPFYQYSGQITDIQTNKIIIQALAEDNLIEKDTSITVIITPATILAKVSAPLTLPENFNPENLSSLITVTPLEFSELKIGDEVIAVSPANLRGVTKFEASRLTVVNDDQKNSQ